MASSSRKGPQPYLIKEKFTQHFSSSSIKHVVYTDPATARGASTHTMRSIAWNPSSTLVATGSADRTIRVWNPERNNVRYSTELKGHTAPIERVAFNPTKDNELCSVSTDGIARFWDVRTRTCFNEVKGLGDAFTLAWTPDGKALVVGNRDDKFYVLSPSQNTPTATHDQAFHANQVVFCWSGTKMFVTSSAGKIHILDYPSFEPTYRFSYFPKDDPRSEFVLNGHTSSCMSVDLQPTGRYLATGGSDSVVALWDTTDWICRRTITSMAGPIRSISFTHEGSYVVGGSDEGNTLDVIHVESGDTAHTFKTIGPAPVVAWAPTKYVLAYSDLGILRTVGLDSSVHSNRG